MGFFGSRFFNRALRTVKEYVDTTGSIHQNPFKVALVRQAENSPWSSVRERTDDRRNIDLACHPAYGMGDVAQR